MSKKHMILMLACCLIGMGAVAAIYLFRVPTNSVLVGLMLLLCPLSHILMMRGMMGGHENHDHDHSTTPLPEATAGPAQE
jgi:hypothetical protein